MSKKVKKKVISTAEFDRKFDAGEDMSEHFDLESAMKLVNVDFPLWMVKALDKESARIGISRQALIKTWIDDRLKMLAGPWDIENRKKAQGKGNLGVQ